MDVTQTPLSSFIGGESQHCISNEFNWIFQHCKSDNKEQIWRDVECPDWPGTRSCWFLHGTCLQIQTSRFITVQYYYLYMAVTVCYDGLFRPNFAQLMDAKCEEERGHAKMVADFQVGRMGDVKLIPHAAIGKATTCHLESRWPRFSYMHCSYMLRSPDKMFRTFRAFEAPWNGSSRSR